MIHLLHHKLPGRTRFRIEGLANNGNLKTHLEERLSDHQDIRHVSASHITGNVLILYDSEKNPRIIADLIGSILNEGSDKSDSEAWGGQKPVKPKKEAFKQTSQPRGKSSPQGLLANAKKDNPDNAPYGLGKDWHTLSVDDVVRILKTDGVHGLNPDQVKERYKQFGPNALPEKQSRPKWHDLLNQLNSIPSWLLGGAAGLSLFTGGILDAAVIVGVLAANTAIGYFTESKAENTINSLQSFVNPLTWVIREGQRIEIPIERVVIGDVLVLKPGINIAADARVIHAANLTVDESMLTGESIPVLKNEKILKHVNCPLSARLNIVYRGTLVIGGQGLAVVTGVGAYTEVGLLQTLLNETASPPSPIEKQLDTMGNQLVVICGLVCAGVFGIGFLRGYGLLVMLRMAVSLAASAVPEGLPTAAMVNFALGLNRMKEKHVLVRHLQAVETLGAIQTICFDKTGTITENRMAVAAVFAGMTWFVVDKFRLVSGQGQAVCESPPELEHLLISCMLCTETRIEKDPATGRYELAGSSTENALIELAMHNGIDPEQISYTYKLLTLEHRSENHLFMMSFHQHTDNRNVISVKGSPPEVLALCKKQLVNGREVELDDEAIRRIQIENDQMAGRHALRVLGVACNPADDNIDPDKGLIWLGLVGMSDPIRPGVKDLIGIFHQAGIETVMITGDQSSTAYAVARELNLSGEKNLEILDSSELPFMEPHKLEAIAKRVNVYARVSPSHKLKIVQGLQNGGRIIAMTGDGINDGPALKAADIGIAMGRSGTDVAREVADVVLEQDNLETLMIAVRDGRAIYSNIRKSVHFFLSTNMSEIFLMLGAIGFGLGFPLNVMQLLWINIISDILPGLALSMEEAEPDIMAMPPRDPNAPIFSRRDFGRMALESAIITSFSVGAYGYGIARYGQGPKAGTIAFHALTLGQLLHAFSCRSEKRHFWGEEKLSPNPYLNIAIGGSMALQILTALVPPFRRFLGISPVSLIDGAVIAAASVLPILINEANKKKVTDVQ